MLTFLRMGLVHWVTRQRGYWCVTLSSQTIRWFQRSLPSVVERRSASSRYSRDALAALGRHRLVLARKIPARAAPTAPRPRDHIPIPKTSSSSWEDNTAARTHTRARANTHTKFKLNVLLLLTFSWQLKSQDVHTRSFQKGCSYNFETPLSLHDNVG